MNVIVDVRGLNFIVPDARAGGAARRSARGMVERKRNSYIHSPDDEHDGFRKGSTHPTRCVALNST